MQAVMDTVELTHDNGNGTAVRGAVFCRPRCSQRVTNDGIEGGRARGWRRNLSASDDLSSTPLSPPSMPSFACLTCTRMLLDAIDWMGHAGFRVTVGRSHVYIDPYRVPEGAPQADLILITHGHYDHFSPQDVERLTKRETWLVGPAAVAERVSGQVHSHRRRARCSTTSSCAAST